MLISLSQFYKSLSLLEGEARQGWGNLGRSFKAKLEVYVLRQVSAAVARRDRQAGLG